MGLFHEGLNRCYMGGGMLAYSDACWAMMDAVVRARARSDRVA